ncbi:MAG: 3-oxoacyl-[acyl-carrier-protein] reductase [Candidatus Omnitrophota bacterium]|nr:MAG: 3-oxoacyl-[acyl-carrier-protein] reductase [Candidatus Omnitrophota bacterium]
MKEFKGKTVIVTGGSRGIGRACCLEFAKSGANVVFTYSKSKEAAGTLEKELLSLEAECLSIQADICNYNQCRNVIEKTVEKFQKIDVLVNNAGIVKDKALVMMTLDDWKQVTDTNLGGTFNMTRATITTLLKQKSGCIVNISSVSGLVGLARQTNYSASKAGIIGFSKSLAKEVAAYNIRVNVICPGYIKTDMVNSLKDKVKDEIIKSIPVNRLGEPKEVAQLCVFLASDKAGYISGDVVKIDGGLAI